MASPATSDGADAAPVNTSTGFNVRVDENKGSCFLGNHVGVWNHGHMQLQAVQESPPPQGQPPAFSFHNKLNSGNMHMASHVAAINDNKSLNDQRDGDDLQAEMVDQVFAPCHKVAPIKPCFE